MQAKSVTLDLSLNEAVLLNNIWNEVCNGFAVPDFERNIGVSQAEALRQLDKVHHAWREHASGATHVDLEMSVAAMDAARRALDIVVLELGPEEFSTRTGFTLQEAAALRESLSSVLPRSHAVTA